METFEKFKKSLSQFGDDTNACDDINACDDMMTLSYVVLGVCCLCHLGMLLMVVIKPWDTSMPKQISVVMISWLGWVCPTVPFHS